MPTFDRYSPLIYEGRYVVDDSEILCPGDFDFRFEKPPMSVRQWEDSMTFAKTNVRVAHNPYNLSCIWDDVPSNVRWLFSVPHLEQKSKPWHDEKLNHLSGSEIGILLGCNDYDTEDDLFRLKCNLMPPKLTTEAMAHGNLFEHTVGDIYSKQRREVCFELGFIEHQFYRYLGVSPDLVTLSGKLIEIKAPFRKRVYPTLSVEQMINWMPSYWHQCQMQAAVIGLDKLDFVRYGVAPNPNHLYKSQFTVTEVPVDHDWLRVNEPTFRRFWQKVLDYRAANPTWRDRVWTEEEQKAYYAIPKYAQRTPQTAPEKKRLWPEEEGRRYYGVTTDKPSKSTATKTTTKCPF